MHSQLKPFHSAQTAAPARPIETPNWWLEMRRAAPAAFGRPAQVTEVTPTDWPKMPAPDARPVLEVDLYYPQDRMADAYQVMEILEAEGYRVNAGEADWLPEGTTSLMIWWKADAETQAKAVFERLRQIETMTVSLAAEPANPHMIGDIQIALGRDF